MLTRLSLATRELTFVLTMIFMCAGAAASISWICFYYKLIHESGSTWFRYVLHAAVALIITIWVTFMMLAIIGCLYVGRSPQPPMPARLLTFH